MSGLRVSPDGSAAPTRCVVRGRRLGFERASPNAAPVYVKALADTGALLAYLDAADRWHERCRLAFGQFRLPLTTSTAVLTDLFHLVGDSPREMDITLPGSSSTQVPSPSRRYPIGTCPTSRR